MINIFKNKKSLLAQFFPVFMLGLFFSFNLVLAQDGGDGMGGCGNAGGDSVGGDGTGGSDGTMSCFLPGTPIQMQDGAIKVIEDVEVGDQVVGFDIETKEFTNNMVQELEAPVRNEWFKVILANGRTLRTTDDHPIYVKEYDNWASIDPEATWKNSKYQVKTQQLKIGQYVMDLDREYSRIIFILNVPEKIQTYNLKKVSNNNTFFAESTLVHNKDGGNLDYCDTCIGRSCEDCPRVPTCTVVCSSYSAWSACSVTCGGGTQSRSRTCTAVNCSTSTEIETRDCNTQACCVDTSWSPATNTVCSGTSFTQTSNCNNTRNRTGTMTCQAGGCEIDFNSSATPILSCQNNDVIGKYTFWENIGCSVSTCLWNPIYNSCGDYTQECGDSTCENASGDAKEEYCQGGDIYVKYRGIDRGCAGPSGAAVCNSQNVDCGHILETSCKTGYTCKEIDSSNAECVPKSSTWTEI